MLIGGGSGDGLSDLEGDGVVVEVEVGWVLSHEDISEDEVVEASWEGHGLDTEEALVLDVENVVLGSELVVSGIDGEGQVWEAAHVGAVRLDGDALDQWVYDGLGSDKE